MKIVVIGGTGLIGSKVVAQLREQEQDAVAASPESGVNILTGEGLPEVLEGTAVVVDVSNSPSFDDEVALRFFETATRNLLVADAQAGVRHHVALSVVGTERLLEGAYFRAKLMQERLIEQASLPYSIVHATQFFEFVKSIANFSMVGNDVRLPPVLIQPMAAEDVARAVTKIAVGTPINGSVEIAGPEELRLDALVRQGLQARKDARAVIADPQALYFGIHVSERTLLPLGKSELAKTTFARWLDQQAA